MICSRCQLTLWPRFLGGFEISEEGELLLWCAPCMVEASPGTAVALVLDLRTCLLGFKGIKV